MDILSFENKRWGSFEQKIEFRHRAALDLVASAGRTLDLGCGDGLFLGLLKAKGIGAVGGDISDIAVQSCRNKGFEASIIPASGRLPWDDGYFAATTMLDVIEHTFEPHALLQEVVRVTKEEVILAVPNFNSLPSRLQVLCGGVAENMRPNKGHVYWFNLVILRELFEANKLEIVAMRANTVWENRFVLGVIMKLLLHLRPSLFALSFVFKLKIKRS